MQLSEHDLKQLDEQTIRSLRTKPLRTLSLKLLTDLIEARDRLNQSPDNNYAVAEKRDGKERCLIGL